MEISSKIPFSIIEEDMTDQELLSLNLLLNSNLNGLTIQEINLGIIKKMEEEAGIHSSVVKHVLDAVADVIRVDDDVQIYTSGTTNIFKYPELSDGQTASELISTFEEKKQLTELVQSTLNRREAMGFRSISVRRCPCRL